MTHAVGDRLSGQPVTGCLLTVAFDSVVVFSDKDEIESLFGDLNYKWEFIAREGWRRLEAVLAILVGTYDCHFVIGVAFLRVIFKNTG